MSWPPIDWDTVDEWAVGLVVNEHVLMHLNEAERILAAVQMRRREVPFREVAVVLKCSVEDVEAMMRRWMRMPQNERARISQRVSV